MYVYLLELSEDGIYELIPVPIIKFLHVEKYNL